MPIGNFVSVLVLALVASVVGAADPTRFDRTQEKFLFDVKLTSGVEVRHAVYRIEALGGRHLLQIRFQTGLAVSSPDGKSVPSLDHVEFDDLISRLVSVVQSDHNGQLDSIQVEPTLLGADWAGLIHYLRTAGIASDSVVGPKSKSVTAAVQTYLSGSMLVRSVCERIAVIEKKCSTKAVSMDPITFRLQNMGKRWGDVKLQSDAGIEVRNLWFAIDVEEK